MLQLREEHKPILDRITADPGMEPQTRLALVQHLQEEEDERLAQIARLAAVARSAPAPARAPESAPAPRGLTVGVLRGAPKPVIAAPPRGEATRVGSLRRSPP